MLPDPIFNSIHRARIVELAEKSRLPAISGARDFTAAGGLMMYGPDYADLFRRAATYVDKEGVNS